MGLLDHDCVLVCVNVSECVCRTVCGCECSRAISRKAKVTYRHIGKAAYGGDT